MSLEHIFKAVLIATSMVAFAYFGAPYPKEKLIVWTLLWIFLVIVILLILFGGYRRF